ncbi:hypothetical protein BGZ99_008620 [Dissophora globulifera]|uniref:Uncharacterized protein n=1 Tax=Dissophora globulifera TaxID=979702 RepID=A0A9P6RRY8_9FUNG|nr:hypothetical protein BGZ99_008620 [Dissophora globulifera]
MYQHSGFHPPGHHNDTLSNFDATDYDAGQGRLYGGVQEEQRRGSHMHDISMLTKRLANLQLMDSLCPSELPQEQREQHQQPSTLVKMDSTWSSQIQLLLVHLADQADLEEKSIHPILTSTSISNAGAGAGVRDAYGSGGSRLPPLGIYEQVLVDWVLRLDQIPANVYKDHPGLKREVDRIRLQQGITKRKPASRGKESRSVDEAGLLGMDDDEDDSTLLLPGTVVIMLEEVAIAAGAP